MHNLLKFILRFHFTILFLIIEAVSFMMIVTYNESQHTSFFSSSNYVAGKLNSSLASISDYFSLKQVNEDLSVENARLRNMLKGSFKSNKITFLEIHDSVYSQQYKFTSAKVIRNSANRDHNYFTIDKGSKHGIKPEMGVIGPNGVAGIVKNVSRNFATVISILNKKLFISGRLSSSGYFGSINWPGDNYLEAKLMDIPYHVKLHVGDTIVTSGFSSIFPEGMLIGTVSDFHLDESDAFYEIDLRLSQDMKEITYVHIISNLFKTEQENLESKLTND